MLLSVLLLFGGLGTGEILLVALVVLLLFGGKKIPEVMSSLGKGVKSFKDGMEGLEEELKNPKKPDPVKEPEKDSPPDKLVG